MVMKINSWINHTNTHMITKASNNTKLIVEGNICFAIEHKRQIKQGQNELKLIYN